MSVGNDFPVLGDAWWIVLTTSTNPSGQPGSGFIIVHGTQAEVDKKYGAGDVKGPYSTQAQAQAAAQKDVGTGPGSISQLAPGQPQVSVPNPLAGLLEIGHFIGDIVSHLTDVAMWRSLGWLALGLLLLLLGINMLFGLSGKFSSAFGKLQGDVAGAV